jgi:hypothetical protein
MNPADYKRLAAIVGGCLLILVTLPHVLWAFRLSGGLSSITVHFGTPFYYNSMYPPQTVLGDGWASTWADDGKIYTTANDTSVFSNTSPTSNMMLDTLSTTANTVVGTTVNQMAAWGQPLDTNTGSPSRSHKWQGILSIGSPSTFYALNWRLDPNYLTNPPFWDAQVLKSTDHGASWSPSPPGGSGNPYASPMFPGDVIPFGFIQYGQNYTGSGPDNSGTYIYALVEDSTIAEAKLSRVLISAIGNQLASDWQYWTGGDGMNPANWSSSVSSAAPVFSGTGVAIITGMQYLPRYQKYIYIGGTGAGTGGEGFLYAFLCDHPWGPCTSQSQDMGIIDLRWMFPMPASLVNGGQQLVVSASGDPGTCCSPTGTYTLIYIPATLSP